jgi:hypothetical protein
MNTIRSFVLVASVLFCLGLVPSASQAQLTANSNFNNKDFYIGPRIGLGGIGGAGFGLGANVEYGVTPQIGITGTFGWSSYSYGYTFYSWTYTNLIFAVGGNYHVDILKVKNLDTYAGLGLGWNVGSVSTKFFLKRNSVIA